MKSPVVSALTGATPRQIDHWVRCGFITPSIDATRGSGHHWEWSTEDVVRVAVMQELVAASMSPYEAAQYAHRSDCEFVGRSYGAVRVLVNVGRIRDALTDRRDLVA